MNFIRSIRLAGVVFLWAGLFLNNWILMFLGISLFTGTYMWTLQKLEKKFLEEEEKED